MLNSLWKTINSNTVYRAITCVFLVLFFLSCRKQVVFRVDPADSRLPEYSQEGRNIAGALIDDEAWRSERLELYSVSYNPLRIFTSTRGDSTILEFNGRYVLSENRRMVFRAVISGFSMLDIDSLPMLVGQTLVLDNERDYWLYDDSSKTFSSSMGKGQLSIHHVRRIESVAYGDNGVLRNPYIVAGTFEVTFPPPASHHVTSGRFDMVVRPRKEFNVY